MTSVGDEDLISGDELGLDKSTELGSNDTEEMINVLSSMEAANILSSGGAAASVSPTDVLPDAGVPTISRSFPIVSGSFPTVSAIFTTASMVTPYTRRSRGITIGSSQPIRILIIGAKDTGKEKMIETEVPKKRKLQEQIDAQVASEMEEEFTRENQRLSEQLARDSEIARLHAKEELKIMIEGLDRSNEVFAKHLSEYKQAKADLSVGEKIELISELIKEKCIPVWKQFKDFVTMSSKEESERVKRQGLKVDQGSSKRMKISEGVSEEELKGMMQLVPLEEVYIEALQQFDKENLHQLWTLEKETFSIKQATRDKEKELWVELKRLFEPDFEDQLWTHHQAFMHDPLDWKLYDTCGVHHLSTKDQEIFMLVEMDYPLRKGLATMMISNKLQESLLGHILYRTLWPIKGVLRKQVGDLSTHTTKYTSLAQTQKVFANTRRVVKGFSRGETPLFEGMLVEQHVAKGDADEVHGEEVNAASVATKGVVSGADDVVPTADEEPSIPSFTPPTPPPQPSQDIPSTSQVKPTPPQSPQSQQPTPHQQQQQPSQDA
nr:hypothetical protein [Tanacetum cinerariifolium]